MRPAIAAPVHVVQIGILRCAARLVPARARREWQREWRSELWHVREATACDAADSWDAERKVTAFCLGAFKDALCLRQCTEKKKQPPLTFRGSAAQCLLLLGLVVTACVLLARLLPAVDAETHLSRYAMRPGLILIQNAESGTDSIATITAWKFRLWQSRPQRYFDDLAYYRMARETVSASGGAAGQLRVAHATANLFEVLGLPLLLATPGRAEDSPTPGVLLSEKTWQRVFHGDPRVVGAVVHIGDQVARVSGVVPVGAWRLPGEADAWMLEPDTAVKGTGYVVAHLTPLGQAEMRGSQIQIAASDSDDGDDDLWGVSFGERTRGPLGLYLFTVFLALLSLPAITSVSLGEYSFCAHKPTWSKRLLRWGFLAAKFLLVLAVAYYASVDVAYWRATSYSVAAENLQLLASFLICLFGMRWVLLDQRQRCPVCLRRVTHPAQVGQASRMFLAWNGVELVCTSGHTLLHVPGMPTSWFSTQRWLYLDSSWEFLFASSGAN